MGEEIFPDISVIGMHCRDRIPIDEVCGGVYSRPSKNEFFKFIVLITNLLNL